MILEAKLNGKIVRTKGVKSMRSELRKAFGGSDYVVKRCKDDKNDYILVIDKIVVGHAKVVEEAK